MGQLYSMVSKTYAGMRNYKITMPLYQLLRKAGLYDLAHQVFSLKFRINPTQSMKNEKQFFSEHAQELKKVYDALEDDRSRGVFESVLRFRATNSWAYLKKSMGKDNLNTQYFVPELPFSNHEIIVNCGANDGSSTKLFYDKIPGCRVIALEPEEKNYESLKKLGLPGLCCIKAGVWSEDTTLVFDDKGGGTGIGSISASGNTKIEVKALDHIPECQSATYIKMDIEGAELAALKGAEKIIREQKPKLAICIYHKPQDFFEIPLFIKDLNPDYRLFVHHHNMDVCETVLYAI